MQVLDGYISYVRPLLKPQCDFVLVNRNGGQHGKLGEIMSKLVFDAIGKYIHPTRYRQIVETESLNQLTSEEQRILSENQKHSSAVAKVHYQKRRSREVTVKGPECLQKLQGSKGSEVDEDVQARFGGSTSSSTMSVETMEKASLSPPRKAVIPTENLCELRGDFIGLLNLWQTRTIFSNKELTGMDMDNGPPFLEIPSSNLKREEQQIL